ncbi:MAG: tRNA pseudouridine(55) synthase TruB [Desulfuromonadales bacterium]|nr:tRNA pseudouridine(55) synthase TruB [Desulfuromonadales bacterium]
MHGILVIDKPEGPTSFDMVRQVRRWCGVRKVGHAGTLDPFATGVLPVAVGQATRLIEYLMAGDKEYEATMRLGAATDTQDLHGQVLTTGDWRQVTCEQVQAVIAPLVGEIDQLPPMFSALKRDGQPLYRLARQGIEVAREPRRVRIDRIELLDFSPPDIRLRVACGKGVYIRTLCHDIGATLGCGAHLVQLRRTRCGRFTEADALPPEELACRAAAGEALPLIPPAEALADWPGIALSGAVLTRLQHGVVPRRDELPALNDLTAGSLIRFLDGADLIALARYSPATGADRSADFELLKVFPRCAAG